MSNSTVRSWSIVAGTACGLSAFAALADEAQAVQAIWKSQEIKFYYQPTEPEFSCDGFERKLKRILKALGAAEVEVALPRADCGTARRQPLVSITLRSPAEVMPEAAADAGQPFAASWRAVNLSRGRLGIEPTDCGMVDHLRQLVLPKLAVRIVQDQMDCYVGAISLSQPKLTVEALVAAD